MTKWTHFKWQIVTENWTEYVGDNTENHPEIKRIQSHEPNVTEWMWIEQQQQIKRLYYSPITNDKFQQQLEHIACVNVKTQTLRLILLEAFNCLYLIVISVCLMLFFFPSICMSNVVVVWTLFFFFVSFQLNSWWFLFFFFFFGHWKWWFFIV